MNIDQKVVADGIGALIDAFDPAKCEAWNGAIEAAAKVHEPSCSCTEPCDDFWVWPSPCHKKAAAVIRALKNQAASMSDPCCDLRKACRPAITQQQIRTLRDTAEAEHAVGDPTTAAALTLLLDWHERIQATLAKLNKAAA